MVWSGWCWESSPASASLRPPYGLAAAEAGNSGVCGATLIPLMELGIPGDVITAVILGTFTLHGLPPGPLLFTQHQSELAPLFWGLILSTPLLFGLVAIRGFSRLSLLPEWALYPAIVTTALFGVYSLQASIFDIQLALITGLAGLTMRQIDLPTTPLLIAFILGPLIEENLRRALLLSQGTLEIFIHSPFVWGCVAATLLLCFWLAIQHHPWLGKRPAMHSGDRPGSAAEKNKLCRKRKGTKEKPIPLIAPASGSPPAAVTCPTSTWACWSTAKSRTINTSTAMRGDESSYDGSALPNRWTSLFGVNQTNFQPGDQAQLQHHPL
ncbi:TRAP-T family transporter, large (12 TMs) inner membrane subunit [endosymbiont of Tevnia jerichonana (vent Tica)]|uniref:TRAP-T family transporter, large (12 TMs) inner membrane subunit n=1 Tax=endosymbiont of Tevnia jerichonana (vent Tica) TaxID=1049564 RepID=G2FEY5_9GAMM|nr:TRAP-T family transporter, large (12 TMs) inner membrane subunit [endosymbiont of Tevnia jerichonana (vent Tica)]